MDSNYKVALWTGSILVFVGLSSLALITWAFTRLGRKQDFGVEVDLGRAANLCVYVGLTILGIVGMGATIEAVLKGIKH